MELPRTTERPDARELDRLAGRDEMNLAEFPITLLTDRVPDNLKSIEFEAGGGKLIVSGSDDLGLPQAVDADVIVGLIQLTKIRNNFTDPTVRFTRYELLKLLGWPDRGAYYARLDESLHRWVGVTLRYVDAWWDNEIKTRVDASFHILESVVILQQGESGKLQQGESGKLRTPGRRRMPSSTFTWNKLFFKSCQAGNLKKLDLETYLSLERPITKQMYRFLDKRFYTRRKWAFDLHEFAFGHIGLSRNYTAFKIKEKLQPAIEELEAVGFLEPLGRDERYVNISRGEWKIVLARKRPEPAKPAREAEAEALDLFKPSDLELGLISRGVTPVTAAKLAGSYPAGHVESRMEVFDWLVSKRDRRVSKSPGGYLAESIRNGYAAPKGFESRADRERKQAEELQRKRAAEEAERRAEADQQARDAEEQARIRNYLEPLTKDERAALESEALAGANSFFARQYRRARGNPENEARYLNLIVEIHVAGILEGRDGGER